MSLASAIAKIGESPNFIAFMAHAGWAAIAVHEAMRLTPTWLALSVPFLLAAYKEFWFDTHYETAPPQTYADGALDFAGYVTGIVLGIFI